MIVYSETTQDEDGEDVVATKTVEHHRAAFDGLAQTDAQWRANIKREIVADLNELNTVAPAAVDITELVN
ncbi:MAG: hypothetical protein QF659_03940 [Dehalococcoidia bacterium]|jgi:hypothetical protein|nr:hypothetical protein [Dehalococcoidia bacterium]